MAIYKNVQRTISFQMVTTAGSSDSTGTPTCMVAQDSGNFTACGNSPVRKTSGGQGTNVWHITLTASEMNGDLVTFMATVAGDVPVVLFMETESDWSSTRAACLDTNIASRLPTGNVTVGGYLANQDPASYVLAVPAQKLATDGSGNVTVGANNDKSGYALSTSGVSTLVSGIWNALLSGMTSAGSIGAKLAGWVLGSDNKSVVSADSGITIENAVWNAVEANHTASGTFGAIQTGTGGGGNLSPEEIADAVWDEQRDQHTTTGSTGALLGEIGDIEGSGFDPNVSSLTKLRAQIAAIAPSEVGIVDWTHVVLKNGIPVDGAAVTYYSDPGRTEIVPPAGVTDENGGTTFHLPAGHYWVRVSIPGDSDRLGEEEVH